MSNRTDPTVWMWTHAFELIEQTERLHQRYFRLAASRPALASWEPPVDVFEDEHEMIIVVAMPGVAPERIQVRDERGTLVVRGVRPMPLAAASGHAVRQLEIPYGVFERRITLPPGPLELGEPELTQGCLVLRIAKRGEVR